jgi:hypothetical protein
VNPATLSNSNRSGSGPSRDRALLTASSDGTVTVAPRPAQATTPASLRITRTAPRSMNSASASVKYNVSHAGSTRRRCSHAPAASITASTSSRGNVFASTPTETRSSRPPRRPGRGYHSKCERILLRVITRRVGTPEVRYIPY